MAPSGGRSPYGPPNSAPSLNEAAAYAYELDGAAGAQGARNYDPRALAAGGYDVRAKHGPPMAMTAGYFPNEEEAHFGPPGTGSYEYGDGYYPTGVPPPRPARHSGHSNTWGYGGGGHQAVSGGGYIDEEYLTAFSDEEADELDSRVGRVHESHARAKSLLRYNELERERSRRRTAIVKQKTSSKLFPGKLKLSMMNTGLIPLKKGKFFSATLLCAVSFGQPQTNLHEDDGSLAGRQTKYAQLGVQTNNAVGNGGFSYCYFSGTQSFITLQLDRASLPK